MNLPLNEKEQVLLDLLLEMPPLYDAAEKHIRCADMNAESITKVAVRYAEECYGEGVDYLSEQGEGGCFDMPPQDGLPGLHSTYIVEVIRLLLKYGADPNAVFQTEWGDCNLMEEIALIDNGYLGVDALVLLLERGGDPGILFEDAAFDIWFGSVEQKTRWLYDIWVHQWMVLCAFGGKSEDKQWPRWMKGYDEDGHYGIVFDVKRLKEHRNFSFCLSFEDGERTLHIFDKKTFWKVAEWR